MMEINAPGTRWAGPRVTLEELQAGPVWALPLGSFSVAHRFKLVGDTLAVRCGTVRPKTLRQVAREGLPLHHAGSFPHCQRCTKFLGPVGRVGYCCMVPGCAFSVPGLTPESKAALEQHICVDHPDAARR